MGLTAEIGRFAADMRIEHVPEPTIATVCMGVTDCVGVMLAGLREPVTAMVARAYGIPFDIGAIAGLQSGIAPAPELALLYGTAAHALDYDDTALSGHPSAVLVPALLAEAAEVGAGGPAMIAAYLVGYEVWAELIGRDKDQHHGKGWHPSAVFGAVAAAAASATLRKLDAARAGHAVGIAASMAGGIVANFGSMTKPFHVGRAAQSGLQAARLAEAGMTAAPDAIEHDLGFLRAISPRAAVDTKSASRLGSDWRILTVGINVKLYPVCYAVHRSLDAMIDLCRTRKLTASDIESVEVELGDNQLAILRNHSPQDVLDARFSLEFAMASAAVAGRCSRAELSEAFIRRPEVQDFFRKVRARPTAEKDREEPALAPFERVRLLLGNGSECVSESISHPRGHFKRPVDGAMLWEKFRDCAGGVVPLKTAQRLFDTFQELPRLASFPGPMGAERAAE